MHISIDLYAMLNYNAGFEIFFFAPVKGPGEAFLFHHDDGLALFDEFGTVENLSSLTNDKLFTSTTRCSDISFAIPVTESSWRFLFSTGCLRGLWRF